MSPATSPAPPARSRWRTRLGATLVAAALAAGPVVTGPTAAAAPGAAAASAVASTEFQRGPAPTASSIDATRGPFAVTSYSISSTAARGFGGGTVTYPTATNQGRFGVVAVSPGYTARESSIAWLGPRLASFGFVVITFDTNSRYDQPNARGTQLLAAIDQVIADRRTSSRVDPARQAVVGHSMGGGGTLAAARTRPSIEAAVGLTAYHTIKNWGDVQAASLQIAAQDDTVARNSSHSERFYASLTAAERRAYLELRGASHYAPNRPNTTIARYTLSWLKRFVDDDQRYEQFLTPGPRPSTTISQYRIS